MSTRVSCAGSRHGSTVAACWLVLLVSSMYSFHTGGLEGALVSAACGPCQSPLPVVPGAIHWYDGGHAGDGGHTGGGADGRSGSSGTTGRVDAGLIRPQHEVVAGCGWRMKSATRNDPHAMVIGGGGLR